MIMNVRHRPILIVQGAQWGSEAKGMVAAALCKRRNVKYAVRTGAVNAGHTVYKDGRKYVNQQLPTGWVNDGTDLVIGPGALIHPTVFSEEIVMIRNNGFKGRILVDHRAGLHLEQHTETASLSNRHYKIGATGKGCSVALINRITGRGDDEPHLFLDWAYREDFKGPFAFTDTVKLLHHAYDHGDQILLEGTQGTFLDLNLGPYPYTTHKQCTASQWVTEAGLSPSMEYEIVLVARTYPIRVAGNSGPMPCEIDWPTLANEINDKRYAAMLPRIVDPKAVLEFMNEHTALEGVYASDLVEKSERNRDAINNCSLAVQAELKKLFEFTTVTKKLRRIARLDMGMLKESVMINRPSWIALTFLNYEFPEHWNRDYSTTPVIDTDWFEYVLDVENGSGCSVQAITTGPEDQHYHQLS